MLSTFVQLISAAVLLAALFRLELQRQKITAPRPPVQMGSLAAGSQLLVASSESKLAAVILPGPQPVCVIFQDPVPAACGSGLQTIAANAVKGGDYRALRMLWSRSFQNIQILPDGKVVPLE
jgi:hypothetical protein